MPQRVRPFLMFEGKAEEAMTFYVSLFPDGKIVDIVRYGPGLAAAEGSVKLASFIVGGQTVMCIDSPPKHGFTFTPAFSLFVDCDTKKTSAGCRRRSARVGWRSWRWVRTDSAGSLHGSTTVMACRGSSTCPEVQRGPADCFT